MSVMPELIMHRIDQSPTKTCIIAKSMMGYAVATFDSEENAKAWLSRSELLGEKRRVQFFKQTITEEEVQINI